MISWLVSPLTNQIMSVQTDMWSLQELLCSFFLCLRLRSELRGLMGTVGLGKVLELWLLGPDVVVEPGEKLADTRAAKEDYKEEIKPHRQMSLSCHGVSVCALTLAVVEAVDGVII